MLRSLAIGDKSKDALAMGNGVAFRTWPDVPDNMTLPYGNGIGPRLKMADHEPEAILDRYAQEHADDPAFIAEGLAIGITEELLEVLERRGLSQSWLAERMGVSRAHVSRILNARPNMTLLTIAKMAVALGVKPDVCLDSAGRRRVEGKREVAMVRERKGK